MFIKRIIKIENVGRLSNCAHHGPEFSRYNLVFAENGRGKTTLCAILRSVQSGIPEYITERKSLGGGAAIPMALIRLDGSNEAFNGAQWDLLVPEILVFDGTYVAQNVFVGEAVGRAQRTNILQIAIGTRGVELSEKIQRLDQDIRELNSSINDLKKNVLRHAAGTPTETFLSLPKIPDIDAKISEKQQLLASLVRIDEVRRTPELTLLEFQNFPADYFDLLRKSVEGVSSEARAIVRRHLAKHPVQDGEDWIAEGLKAISEDNECPFCAQSLEGLPLIDAFAKIFSEEYRILEFNVEEMSNDFSETSFEMNVSRARETLLRNEGGLVFWRQFLKVENVDLVGMDTSLVVAIRAFNGACANAISLKLKRMSAAVAETEIAKIEEAFRNVQTVIDATNARIHAVNALVAAKKAELESSNVASERRELELLRLTRSRHQNPAKEDCQKYVGAVQHKIVLEAEKEQAKQELDTYADQMMKEYEDAINSYLGSFGAGFSLTNSKKTYVGGTPTSQFQIMINRQAIDLGDANSPLGVPSFRNTLSAGDRSSLALAFFLAQIDRMPDQKEMIVVLDDPFNSLDRSRRERTAELIKLVGEKVRQVFVLSHDPYFLNLVAKKLQASELRQVQLSRSTGNTSTIEDWDSAKECQDAYFRDHDRLSLYIQQGAPILLPVAQSIRPVMEGYLRHRFPGQFGDTEWLGDMIGHIRQSGVGHPLYQSLAELSAINDYSKQFHHDVSGQRPMPDVSDGELTAFVERTLAVVGGY